MFYIIHVEMQPCLIFVAVCSVLTRSQPWGSSQKKKLRWPTKSQEDMPVKVQGQALSQGDL